MRVFLILLALSLADLKLDAQGFSSITWNEDAIGQLRFLYGITKTEFAGCLYGRQSHDTLIINFFISGKIDPRSATDSGVSQGGCPRITTTRGDRMIGIFHSHMRVGSTCSPSGFGGDPDLPAKKDRAVLTIWLSLGARLGALLCARGDSLAMYTLKGYGIIGIPPLDSLYANVNR